MSKHTPGPWSCEKSDQGGYFIRGGINGQSFEVVCDIPEAREADRNLLATAPELYDVAEDMLDLLCLLDSGNTTEEMYRQIRKKAKRAQAAIAKAEKGT